MPIFKGKAAIVPRPELPGLVEPEEQPVMMVPVAEVMMLEMRQLRRAMIVRASSSRSRRTKTAARMRRQLRSSGARRRHSWSTFSAFSWRPAA